MHRVDIHHVGSFSYPNLCTLKYPARKTLLRLTIFHSLVQIPSNPQLRLSTRFVGSVRNSTDDQILATCQDLWRNLERINARASRCCGGQSCMRPNYCTTRFLGNNDTGLVETGEVKVSSIYNRSTYADIPWPCREST